MLITDYKTLDKKLANLLSEKNNNGWNIFSERFVAFLDISGFKNASKHNYYSYSILLAFKEITEKCTQIYTDGNNDKFIHLIAVSDSILVFSKDDSVTSFCCFCHAVGYIFNSSIIMGRMMTAAMAYGHIMVDIQNGIFCGDAYNKAYKLQENIDYFGIVCDESINSYLDKAHSCNIDATKIYLNLFYDINFPKKKTKNISFKNCKNFLWYDFIFSEISNLHITWGNESIGLCKIDGMVSGSYFQIISNILESYGDLLDEDNDNKDKNKIIKRLNNTMYVLESMLKKRNDHITFQRYIIDHRK